MATTTSTSTVPALFDALADALAARPGLAGVTVSSAPLALDQAGTACLQLVDTDDETQEGTTGNRRREERFTINGMIYVAQSGAGEATIRAVRDRAFAIQAEIEDQLRTDHAVGGVVTWCQFAGSVLDQGISAGNERVARLTFRLGVRADLRS